MRRRHQNGKQSGSALQQQGKRPHPKRGYLVGGQLLQLLVLLAAQQGFHLGTARFLSRSILQPAAVVVGTLLAPQAAQAQTVSTVLTATAGVNKVTLTWVATNVGATLSSGNPACPNYPFSRWEYRQKAGSNNYGSWTTLSTTHTTNSHEVTGLTAGTVYKFQVRPVWACVSPLTTALTTGTSNEDTATPTAAVSPGVTISDETLTINEGASDTYTVVLDTDPGAQVVVTPTPTAKVTVSPAKLTFTTATNNWSTAQTVTVTGVAAGSATVSHTVTGYTGVQNSDIDDVDVTVNAIAAPVLTETTLDNLGGLNIKYTHAGTSVGDLVSGGAINFACWQTSHRMKGGTWTNDACNSSNSTISVRNIIQVGLYPHGTLMQVRVRAKGNDGTNDLYGPWSNTREATVRNDDDGDDALAFSGSSVTVGVGATSTYTVAMGDNYNYGAGVVSVSSSDSSKVTVSPSTLTFTTSTYTTAQTVTVTGVATGGSPKINHAFRLTGARADAIPDAGAVGVTVNNKTITLSADSTTITEGDSGRKDVTITVVLGEGAPSNSFPVGFSLDSTSTGKATTNPLSSACTSPTPADADMCWSQYVGHGSAGSFNAASLTLSSGATTGTMKIGILGDTTDEPDETLKLRATASGYTAGTLTLTIKDDDGPGVTISEDTLTMDKGDSATYTVVLDTDPGAQVVVTPTSGTPAKATVSGALTFTTATNNWSTAQTVTVTGVAAGTATIRHRVAGYNGVSGSDIDTVDVTVEETIAAPDLTGATSTTSGDINLTWTHGGSSAGDYISGGNFYFWQASHRLKGANTWKDTFSPSNNGGTSRRTTAMGLGSEYPDGAAVEVRIRAAAEPINSSGPWSNTRTVTYKNDNLAALTITGDPVTVTEASSTTYTVALTKAYGGVLSVTSDNTDKATVSPATLTFTTGNYNTAQTVTVTGVATGGSPEINHAFRLTGATADAIPDAGSVDVTVKAPPSVTVEPTVLTVNEGSSGAYTVKLDTEPTADVTVTVAGESGDVTVTGSPLTFTTQNYGTAQTVTVNAAEDDDAVTDTAVTLTQSASGGGYNSVTIDSVQVTVTENDTPGVTVEPTALTVNEGSSATYTVKLNTEPTAEVTVTVGGASGEVTVTGSPLTFTTENYGTAQTVTVNAAEDNDPTNDSATLTHTAVSSDTTYSTSSSLSIESVSVTVTDNDTPGVTVEPTALSVNEGSSGTYTVKLNTAPTHNVTVTVGGASGEVTVTGSPLTFTTQNYGTAQTVTVNAGEDQDSDNDSATLTHSAASSDTTYSTSSSLTIESVRVTVTDNDQPTGGGGSGSGGSGGGGGTPSSVPAAPTGVGGSAASTSAGNGQVRLTWANPGDATIRKWQVQWREISGPTGARLELEAASYRPGGQPAQPAQEGGSYGDWMDIPGSTASTTSHTVTGLTNGKTYGFRIRAVNTADRPGLPSSEIRVTLRQAPSKPTGVTATAGDGQVSLAWTGPTDATISKWQVQQKESSGSYGAWVDIPASTASTRSHPVTGLTNGTAYGFRIRAVNTTGNGAVSDEVTATPLQLPSKPTGVTATPGNGQVVLTWDNPDDATITRWQIQQKEGSGSYGPWRDLPNSTASTTSHTVTGLANGTAYGFRIRAVNAGGNGDPSDEVTATPVHPDVVQADKARTQALAATSRTLLGMATDVLGARTGGDAPMALAAADDSLGEQAMGVVENLLGVNGSELPTALTLEDVEDRLWSQSFQLAPPAEESSTGQQSWAFWGAGELRSYRSEEEAEGLSSSGNLKTAWLGVDYPFTHRGLAGLALSFSSGQSDYTYRKVEGATDGGRMDTRLTTFYPYGSFQVSEHLRLWAMAGIGWGSQHHQQTGDDAKAEGDLRLQMGVVGFERQLDAIGDVNLSLAGDAGLVKSTTAWQGGSGLEDLSVSLHRIRMGVEGSLPLNAHTTGYLKLKGRIDGGDLPMNAAELVAGVQYSQARFTGFLQGRQVYAFDGSYAESALTAQLRLTTNSDGTGLAWTLQPSYGASDGDLALAAGPSLWTDEQLEALTGSGSAQQSGEMALSSRVGYGIHLQSGDLLLTPFTEVRFREAGSQHIGLGLALEGNYWNVELSSSTEKGANASPTTKTELNFSKKL